MKQNRKKYLKLTAKIQIVFKLYTFISCSMMFFDVNVLIPY